MRTYYGYKVKYLEALQVTKNYKNVLPYAPFLHCDLIANPRMIRHEFRKNIRVNIKYKTIFVNKQLPYVM